MQNEAWTLAAVALGGTLAAGSQFLSDGLGARRARRQKWHDERLRLYSEILTHILPAAEWIDEAVDAIQDGEEQAVDAVQPFDLLQWARGMEPLLSQVNLVGSQAVIDEVVSLHFVVRARGHLALAVIEKEQPAEVLAPAADAIDTLLSEMTTDCVNAMRADVGEGRIKSAFSRLVRDGEDDEDRRPLPDPT